MPSRTGLISFTLIGTFSLLLNLNHFFEFRTVNDTYSYEEENRTYSFAYVRAEPTKLRFLWRNYHPTLYLCFSRISPTYSSINMIKVVLVVNILPTILLIYLNHQIYKVIRNRALALRNLSNRKVDVNSQPIYKVLTWLVVSFLWPLTYST